MVQTLHPPHVSLAASLLPYIKVLADPGQNLVAAQTIFRPAPLPSISTHDLTNKARASLRWYLLGRLPGTCVCSAPSIRISWGLAPEGLGLSLPCHLAFGQGHAAAGPRKWWFTKARMLAKKML